MSVECSIPPQDGQIPNVGSATRDLVSLAQWLSPAFPVGSYAYSQGLEPAVSNGDVSDAATLRDWVGDCLTNGSGRKDAVLLCNSRNMLDAAGLDDVAEFARALCGSRERFLDTMEQGRAFVLTVNALRAEDLRVMPYPVAVGAASRHLELSDETIAAFYLLAFASALVSAAVRLIPLGQTAGQMVLDSMIPLIGLVSEEAAKTSLDDVGGCAFRADMASMHHETMEIRLFRS